ncbi:MAG: hypothetical protein ACLPKB_10220 [Xanthobacteraceae bacterium]
MRNALVLRVVEREPNALRTALEVVFSFRFALGVSFRFSLPVAFRLELSRVSPPTELLGVWTATGRLLRKLGCADERDIAGLALIRAPPPTARAAPPPPMARAPAPPP